MVVDGALGVLFRHAVAWSRVIELKNQPVILDMTHSLYWFTRRLLLATNRMDLYGCSMVEYGAFVRDFLQHLLARNVTPIIVYEGGRLSESQHGELVSKSRLMAQSCRHAMDSLNACRQQLSRYRYPTFLPPLAANTLKEVVNELQLEFVIQARHEVYPLLEKLARERLCPVISSHADLIFYNLPEGFIWLNVIRLPATRSEPFACRLFEHYKMMDYYNLMLANDCLALRTLFVLMRSDFRQKYFEQINELLRLDGELELSENLQDGRVTRRLEHILESWTDNLNLTSFGTIRSTLIDQNRNDRELLRDFDMIYESFTNYGGDFRTSEYARDFRQHELNEALTSRESSAEFLLSLHSTLNARPEIEDTRLLRSAFSLHDNCRQHLMATLRDLRAVDILDRAHDELIHRTLIARANFLPLDRDSLFHLFHFQAGQVRAISRELVALGLGPTSSSQLALVLLLAHFGLKLMHRNHYGNEPDEEETSRRNQIVENSASISSDSGLSHDSGLASVTQEISTVGGQRDSGAGGGLRQAQEERRIVFTAIVNSHIHHAKRRRGNKSTCPADIRVARDKLNKLAKSSPKLRPFARANLNKYFRVKHTIEMLNSVLHGYTELNSLYNYPGPKVYTSKHFDGLLIYKIISGWSNTLRSHLIELHGEQLNQLILSTTNTQFNDNLQVVSN